MSRTIVIAVLCLATCAGFAQTVGRSGELVIWEPSSVPSFLLKIDPYPPATVPKPMITSLDISNFQIMLEDTELKATRARFGGGIGQKGDAGEYAAWLCLQGGDEAGPWVLWLESGEIDGPYVGGFQWRRVPVDAQFDPRCQAPGKADSEIRVPTGLRLGMTEAKVLKILGKPTLRKGDTLVYEHEHNEIIRNEPYTSVNSVIVVLRRGVVLAIYVDKTTSS